MVGYGSVIGIKWTAYAARKQRLNRLIRKRNQMPMYLKYMRDNDLLPAIGKDSGLE